MDHVEVELPIHFHPMKPLEDGRRGDCCGIKFEGISDGYYCTKCDLFFHKTCSSNAAKWTKYPSHTCGEPLIMSTYHFQKMRCGICRETISSRAKVYECPDHSDFVTHLECVKYPPPEVVDVPRNHYHRHKLKLEMVESCFTCAACEENGDGYSYKCHECDLTFHVKCGKYEAKVNHPYHFLHPLKFFSGGELPDYSDGRCRLCGEEFHEAFYHCSACNFSLDMQCVLNPPPLYLHDLNTHDHKLTLIPNFISFTCTTCGLRGDRSPYVCLQCNFICHNDCFGFPRVININRHDHRVSRTSLIGVVNAVCGVGRKKMDWTCGGYSCQRCPGYVCHTKCASREDVWNGKELKAKPEEYEDIGPYTVIDDSTIQHFLHKEHYLIRLYTSGIFIEEMSCKVCAYPICLQSFYSCVSCNFVIHQYCAEMPQKKRHMVSNIPYDLIRVDNNRCCKCDACGVNYNGFGYDSGAHKLHVGCASVSESFVHPSHPYHPLYYTSTRGVCSACNEEAHHMLRCIEDDCEYVLDFKCATLPQVVKHSADDHFLSLCYGKPKRGKCWCDICEKETNPEAWFYICNECGVTLHIDCVLGDFRGLHPGSQVSMYNSAGISKDYEVVHNNNISRPCCSVCMSRCIFPTILKLYDYHGNSEKYVCSIKCCDI